MQISLMVACSIKSLLTCFRLDLSGEAWAAIVNKQPLNSALLFKVSFWIRSGWFSNPNMSTQVALLLRDEDDLVKDRFIHNLKLPENFMYVRQVDIS